MKKVLISRYGAFGDVLHCSHLPRLLKEKGFDYVAFEANHKGYQILVENPYIDELIYFDLESPAMKTAPMSVLWKHWEIISEGYDKFINLFRTIEYKYLAMEDMDEYYRNNNFRRNKYGNINYYDIATIEAGYPEEVGRKGELYFNDGEINIVEKWLETRNKTFNILINLSGSSLHKKFVQAEEVINKILEKYEDAHIIITGDKSCKDHGFKNDRIESIAGNMPFRQAICLSKYMDLVISLESGLGVAANLLEAPTIQLMTAANLKNHPDNAKNDLSLQSPAPCSPCHKGSYNYIGCPVKNGLPICVYFDVDKILEKVDLAHESYEKKFVL